MILEKTDFSFPPPLPEQIFNLRKIDRVNPEDGKQSHQSTQIYPGDTFTLIADDSRQLDDYVGHTLQEDLIKIHFRLGGKSTVILDGIGQYVIDKPQVIITSCPQDMFKIDLMHADVRYLSVSLCVQRNFFSTCLGMTPDGLPEPLRSVAVAKDTEFTAYNFPLTPDLAAAVRTTLVGAYAASLRRLFYESKAVELMCLLIGSMQQEDNGRIRRDTSAHRNTDCLYGARDFISNHYTEALTLSGISRHVGVNKTTLSAEFRRHFGLSVFEYIQQQRMTHARRLLQSGEYTIEQVAGSVGFNHACNFSTAFHRYFGCSPSDVRAGKPLIRRV